MSRHRWTATWQGAQNVITVSFETDRGIVVANYELLSRWMVGKPLPYVLRQIKPYGGTINVL